MTTSCRVASCLAFGVFAAIACDALGAGPDKRMAPEPRNPTGRISEWTIPTHQAARDPAVDPQGNVFYAVSRGDRIARFEPESQRFTEWKVPDGTKPQGIVVTADGMVYFGGNASGSIGELNPRTGAVRMLRPADPAGTIYSMSGDADGNLWFTERAAGRVGRYDRNKGSFTAWPIGGEPYALVPDKRGRIWVTRIAADRLGRLDPRTGETTEIPTGAGSRPRRLAVAPDGMIWVTLYGTGKLIKVDPDAQKIIREYDLPGGPNPGPYSVAVDSAGRVWVGVFQTDSVVVFDPRTEKFRTFPLPAKMSGIRNAVIDPSGRFWYLATSLGRIGVIE